MKKNAVLVLVLALSLGLARGEEEAEKSARGWLGVYTEHLSQPMLIALVIDQGVLVTEVVEGSPAAKAGFEVGDVILELDGEKVTDGGDLRHLVRMRPDKKVDVSVRRRGKQQKLAVTLGTREASAWSHEFELGELPGDVVRVVQKAFKKADGSREFEVLRDLPLDSLRKELEQVKKELKELTKKLAEQQGK